MNKSKRMKSNGERIKKAKSETTKYKLNKPNKSKVLKIIVSIILIFISILILFAVKYIINKGEQIDEQSKETNANVINANVINMKTEKMITQEREYKKMQIENIKIYEEMWHVYFSAEIKNTTKATFNKRNVTIVFVDENKESIVEYRMHIKEIKAGETIEIKLMGNQKIEQAYDFRIMD